MTITPSQCRAGRALLGISQSELAGLSRVSVRAVAGFEAEKTTPIASTLHAIQSGLETAGVEFIPENGAGVGVRHRKHPKIPELEHPMSLDYLGFMAQGDRGLKFERAFPIGALKRDLITIVESDGRDAQIRTAMGFNASLIEVPLPVFNDLVRSGCIAQLGAASPDGTTEWRLTGIGVRIGTTPIPG